MCLRGLFFFMHKRKTGTAIHKRFLFFLILTSYICFQLAGGLRTLSCMRSLRPVGSKRPPWGADKMGPVSTGRNGRGEDYKSGKIDD